MIITFWQIHWLDINGKILVITQHGMNFIGTKPSGSRFLHNAPHIQIWGIYNKTCQNNSKTDFPSFWHSL